MPNQGTDSIDIVGSQASKRSTDSVDVVTVSTLSVPNLPISKVFVPRNPHDLGEWVNLIKTATSKDDVFAILDQFRSLPWTDEQRARISKTYIQLLQHLN